MYWKRWGERNTSDRVHVTLFSPPQGFGTHAVIIPLIPATNLVSLQSDLPRSSRHINDAHRIRTRWTISTTKITKEKKIPGRGLAVIIVKTVFIHQRTDCHTTTKETDSFPLFRLQLHHSESKRLNARHKCNCLPDQTVERTRVHFGNRSMLSNVW